MNLSLNLNFQLDLTDSVSDLTNLHLLLTQFWPILDSSLFTIFIHFWPFFDNILIQSVSFCRAILTQFPLSFDSVSTQFILSFQLVYTQFIPSFDSVLTQFWLSFHSVSYRHFKPWIFPIAGWTCWCSGDFELPCAWEKVRICAHSTASSDLSSKNRKEMHFRARIDGWCTIGRKMSTCHWISKMPKSGTGPAQTNLSRSGLRLRAQTSQLWALRTNK